MRLKFASCLVVALAMVFGAQTASASSIALFLSDGTNTVTVYDNDLTASIGSHADSQSTSGWIVWSGSVGDWLFTLADGRSEDLLSTPGALNLTLSASTGNAGTTTTLQVQLTQYNMTASYPGYTASFGGEADSGVEVYVDPFYGNGAFGFSGFLNPPSALGPYTGTFGDTFSNSISGSNPFSITQQVYFVPTGSGALNASGDFKLTPVPEPGSLLLLGGGLVGLAGAARRRMRAKRT